MPRTDPITGCPVLTTAEFWTAEARAEGRGRNGADLMNEFLQEMEDDANSTAKAYRDDLPGTARLLQKAIADANESLDSDTPLPPMISLLEIIEVHVRESFRHSTLRIRARATRADAHGVVEDILSLTHCNSSGSRLEPPDEEITLAWESLPIHDT